MPNNAQLQNAAYYGFIQGAQNANISSVTAADYAPVCAAALVFAANLDARIPNDGTIVTPTTAVTVAKVNTMQGICAGAFSGRVPLSTTSADYDAIAAAIAVSYGKAILSLV
jgi:hypothetical protein